MADARSQKLDRPAARIGTIGHRPWKGVQLPVSEGASGVALSKQARVAAHSRIVCTERRLAEKVALKALGNWQGVSLARGHGYPNGSLVVELRDASLLTPVRQVELGPKALAPLCQRA